LTQENIPLCKREYSTDKIEKSLGVLIFTIHGYGYTTSLDAIRGWNAPDGIFSFTKWNIL
jgi:hypothetical protein